MFWLKRKKNSKWLAEQLDKDPATISKWCTNSSQASLKTLLEIAKVLNVDVRELIAPTDNKKNNDVTILRQNLS